MKLIKLNSDHYIVVNDSTAYPGVNLVYSYVTNSIVTFTDPRHFSEGTYNTVTHSTQPLYKNDFWAIKELKLSEVKSLLGEVDVEKRADEIVPDLSRKSFVRIGFIAGYNQALEDNKDKKYTEEDMKECVKSILRDLNTHNEVDKPVNFVWTESFKKHIQSLQPKTEWEVEFDKNGKLKLKES